MSRRIFALLAAVLAAHSVSFCQGAAASDDLAKKVLADAHFDKAIEITIIPNQYWGWQLPNLDMSVMYLKIEDFLQLLVARGYGTAGTDIANTFMPTFKLITIMRLEKSWPNDVYHIPIAKRCLIKITYQNRWKELGINQFSIVFSYKLEPLLEGMKESSALAGKIVSYLDPSDGKWSISGRSLDDKIAEFIKSNLEK